jgi:uncharacterized membrane protein YdbT with pleckstrin-like domain
MNPFSDFHPNEEILRQERLHPGIFALPVVLFVAFLVPTIPVLFFLNTMGNMLGQINPQGPRSPFPVFGLVLVAMDLLPALLFFIVVLLAYQNSEITLTNKRLIYRTGFVARVAGELPLENVEAIFILEPLLGRLLGYPYVEHCIPISRRSRAPPQLSGGPTVRAHPRS